MRVTAEELARRTGEPVERVLDWRARGLLGDFERGFHPSDVERARLVQLLLRRGFDLDAVVAWAREGGIERHVESLPSSSAGGAYSQEEAAARVGLDPALVRRASEAAGFGEPGEPFDDDGLEALRALKTALDAGFPEEALMQYARVYADTFARVAEMEARLFNFYVVDRLRAQGVSAAELARARQATTDASLPLVEPMLRYFHQLALRRAMRETAALDLAAETGLRPPPTVPGELDAAIVFVDLSGFTPLADAMGDVKAAEVVARFGVVVREVTDRWDGRVVKQIGDAFMLVFPTPRQAVASALAIDERAGQEPQFLAVRSGVHWGRALYRDGDYVGTNVNLASRVAGEAGRHQVLTTRAVRERCGGLAGVEFVLLGSRRLRGLAEEVEIFEARAATGASSSKVIDPVCGMELAAAEVGARLTVGHREHAFCSTACLRRYVATPERYPPAPRS
jgi:class 3 adenylate cyclase